jgi:hypothetical protein
MRLYFYPASLLLIQIEHQIFRIKPVLRQSLCTYGGHVMKYADFLLSMIVSGVTQAPNKMLAISSSQSNIQDNIPTVSSSPTMHEGARLTPPSLSE